MAAQLVHAAGESSPGKLPEGTYAVVLKTSMSKLLALEQHLQSAEISYKAIREPDLPWNGELLAIGIKPMMRQPLKKYLSSFPLLR